MLTSNPLISRPGTLKAQESYLRKSRKSRAKAKPSRKRGCKPTAIGLVDQLDPDFTLASRYRKPVQKFYSEDCRTVTELRRLSKDEAMSGPVKFGIYSGTDFCQKRASGVKDALRKTSAAFGSISREKSFSFALRCITVCGMNPNDFKNLMRIRDLWVRGCISSYKKHINRYVFSLPGWARLVASQHELLTGGGT